MKKLAVVADDFGLCESVNVGILDSHQKGIVTELSIMLGSPGTDHAVELIRAHSVQNVGIHMLLKNWRDTGKLVYRPDYIQMFKELSEAEIAKLVRAELAEFENLLGRKPSHITSQYGIVGHPKALPTVIEYATANHIPMRMPSNALYVNGEIVHDDWATAELHKHHVTTTNYLFAHIMGDDYATIRQAFLDDFASIGEDETAEVCLHPGYYSEELAASSSLVHERERDTKLAMDTGFREAIEGMRIEIVGYGQI